MNVSTVRAAVRAKVTSEFLVLRRAPSKLGLHELDNKHRCSVHRSKLIVHFGEVAHCVRQEAQTPILDTNTRFYVRAYYVQDPLSDRMQ